MAAGADPNTELGDLKEAWAQTLHVQKIFLALLDNPPRDAERDVLEAINHLPFVFDSLDRTYEPRDDKADTT